MGPLLESKLRVPQPRPGQVVRDRLSDRLSGAGAAKLVLVSAPAGFGKTTALAQWLASSQATRSVAWLSLDPRDNDPVVFFQYLVAALRAAIPGLGVEVLALLESPHRSVESVLSTALNELHAVPDGVVLVVDDTHLIDSREVWDGVVFLVEHLPPQVVVVLATRADPPVPLARFRARGELVEIRAADLRFTAEEASAYLNQSMSLVLTASDVATLEERTEGWIAALQLAALSLQGRRDVAGFIADFAGDDRHIVDYLVEEVLQRQPDDVREFLLATSVLSRLTGPLCDAVTGRGDGRTRLEALERGNLFVVPLDDRRSWYRYHHLFADVLQARLLDEQPGRLHDLHRRASNWFEQHGERSEAVRHALAAQDVERAARLVELAIPAMRQSRQEATLRGWLEALPDEIVSVRPVLIVGLASSLMVRGETAGVEERLRQAERWLEAPNGRPGELAGRMVVADEAAYRALPSAIALYRAALARVRGDVTATMTHARKALELAGEDDQVGRGAPAALLGLAHWTTGELDVAHRWWSRSMADFESAGHISDVVAGCGALADIRIAQGRLCEAMTSYEQGLRLATEGGRSPARGAADMHVGMSEVLRERGEVEGAADHLRAARELGEHGGLPQNRHRWCIAMAKVRRTLGDLDGAVELLDEAARIYVADFFPEVRPVWALRARVLVAQGRWDDALTATRVHGLSPDDELSYVREFGHITLAAVLVAKGTHERAEHPLGEAVQLLDRLIHAADEGGRAGSTAEILVLQTLVHQARGDEDAAVSALERALRWAEPEGSVRVFVDEGPRLIPLLRAAAQRPGATSHVRRVLSALSRTTGPSSVPHGTAAGLSPREMDVLRLLRSNLDGPGIARELVISLNTVRTHTKNIYAKLGATSRREAVRRAQELNLLG